MSTIQLITAFYNSLTLTKLTPRYRVLKGLIPMVLVLLMVYCVFGFTSWAWSFPGYAHLMMVPVVSIINSRQIVCNVTDMKMDNFPKVTLWYLLFPVNTLLNLRFDESHIAMVIFFVTIVWYLHFAVGTVN
jgi:hypothetical protein